MSSGYDVIGFWSEIKLSIIKEYASAYSRILTSKKLFHTYIDAFAGPGDHISETQKKLVAGTPRIALETQPPFSELTCNLS